MPTASATKEEEKCLSYGTSESKQEVALEMRVNNDGDSWLESWRTCSAA